MITSIVGKLFTTLKYFTNQCFRTNRYKLTKSAIQYILSEDCCFSPEEKKNLKKSLSKILISAINYTFVKEYHYRRVSVFYDKTKSLYFVFHKKKKLFFKKGLSKKEVINMYNALCAEQDARSPHFYMSDSISYYSTDIAVDIGAAEGIWALEIVEKVNNIYIFECESGWIEALQATFEPWKEKVCVINKYVTDFSDETHTALDDYFLNKNIYPNIIKADIEGAETNCLKGASKLLNLSIYHALICTYHNYDDFEILSDMMKKNNFEVEPSRGYMAAIYTVKNFDCDDVSKLFRKGLIHAFKPRQ